MRRVFSFIIFLSIFILIISMNFYIEVCCTCAYIDLIELHLFVSNATDECFFSMCLRSSKILNSKVFSVWYYKVKLKWCAFRMNVQFSVIMCVCMYGAAFGDSLHPLLDYLVFHQQSGIKPNILSMERIISNSKTKRLIDKSWIEKIGIWKKKTTKNKRRFECECKLETPCSNTLRSNL